MAKEPKPKGVGAVRQAEGDSRRALDRARRFRDDPAPLEPRGENKVPAGQWTAHFRSGLPNDVGCEFPLICLGVAPDGYFAFTDSAGQFRCEPAAFFTHAGIQDIFAVCPNYPEWLAPRWAKTKEGEKPRIESFKDDQIRKIIFRACGRNKLFEPAEKIRGRGAWRLRGGQLVYHAGEELWTCEAGRLISLETGMFEEHLYPRMAELPPPWEEAITPQNNPARALLDTFKKWSWERPDIDPLLLLGWIGVAFLGGALDWRPALFLIGGFGTGKSTLQEAIKAIFGDALFQSAETTAAGIYQRMKQDSRPIAVDELEPDADPRKVAAVVRLARSASSGAMGHRGGAEGHGTEFQMRSAFLFSAINNPLQKAEDLSRVAILRLRTLDPNQPRPAPVDVDTTGRMALAQLLREWRRFPATLAAYCAVLAGCGHTARGQATYGTLLAAADLMLGPELADELGIDTTGNLSWVSDNLAPDLLPEVDDATPNWRGCIEHLLTARVEVWRNGVRNTVGRLLQDLTGENLAEIDAIRDLDMVGLGLINARAGALADAGVRPDEGYVLAVPNNTTLVGKLFEDSPWASTGGVGGPWKDALRQACEFSVVITDKRVNRVRVAGIQSRCSLIVLRRFHERPER